MRLQGQAKCDTESDALKDKFINWNLTKLKMFAL